MRIALADIPIELRAEAAWHQVNEGADPFLALYAALWPTGIVSTTSVVDGFCKRGHPWTEENTYYRKGTTWRKCRQCEREQRGSRTRRPHLHHRKVPCAYCGDPATPPGESGTGGLPTPRCRRCFWKHYNEKRRAGRD